MSTVSEVDTSRTIRLDSGLVHYNDIGVGDPVVLLHGSGPGATSWSNFRPNIPELSRHFRVLAVDMPGWGESEAVPLRERDHPTTVVQLLDALGIEQAAFVGNSMGGVISLAVAALHPDRISHLITMGSASQPRPVLFQAGGGPSEGMKTLFAGYQDPSVANMRRLAEVMTYDTGEGAEEVAKDRAKAAQAHPEHLEHFLTGIAEGGAPVSRWTRPEELAGITAPSLLIHGRDDRVVAFEHSLQLVSLIGNSRLVLLNRCGHWAQLEHAEEFNRLVIDFIKGN